MNTVPSASVIVAVYNQFHWLELILDALQMQTSNDFEVIIADDGSDEETIAQIQKYISHHPHLVLSHVRQEDKGWRKNRALNNAVRKAKSNYLIFLDGDCIPHPQFVEDHLRLSKPGRMVSGRRVDMSQLVSEKVESWTSLPNNYFYKAKGFIIRDFLRDPLSGSLSQLRRMIRFPFLFGRPLCTRSRGLLGCNMGMFKVDLEALNGFDEDYIHPGVGEDTDLELRAHSAGMQCLIVPRHALVLHRFHRRLPLDSPENITILENHRRHHSTSIQNGLYKLD